MTSQKLQIGFLMTSLMLNKNVIYERPFLKCSNVNDAFSVQSPNSPNDDALYLSKAPLQLYSIITRN